MPLDTRTLVRVADRIRDQVRSMQSSRCSQLQQKLQHVLEQMERLKAIQNRLSVCTSRRWESGMERIATAIEPALREMTYNIDETQHAVRNSTVRVPSLRDVFQDLLQADEEFGNLSYDARNKTLSVTTEPIELEGIYLGSFEIQLRIPSLGEAHRGGVYDIVALEPNPASSNDAVTHPHVSDGRMCEGDASVTIQAALAGGRICDVFQLVNSVLTHYNADSPYVSLDNWNGVSCYECGYVMAPDDSHWCSSCESDFCSECTSYCARCDETTCLGCLKECQLCEESVCASCLTKCPDCGQELCTHCLNDEACPCHEEEEDGDECERDSEGDAEEGSGERQEHSGAEAARVTAPAAAGSTVHADSMGQTAVLPGQRPD